MHNDPWHYPRPGFAGTVLSMLMGGPATALTLFGPRRIGKTEFLLRDLGPLADRRRHPVVYASFWQSAAHPAAVLAHELDLAAGRRSFLNRLQRGVGTVRPRIKVSATGVGGGELDLSGADGGLPADALVALDARFDRLGATPERPALLLLDEVQEIGAEGADAAFVAALRTSLDKRADRVRTVFTGSSLEGLRAMFGAREAPFFHFATAIELPPLERPFVRHLLAAFRRSSGRELDEDAAVAAFGRLHGSPFFFRRLLEAMLIDPDLGVEAGVDRVRAGLAEELGYGRTWGAMTPIQRAVVRVLAEGEEKPFSKAARERLGRLLAEQVPSASRVQTAVNTLRRQGVLDRPGEVWTIADPEFAAWALGAD